MMIVGNIESHPHSGIVDLDGGQIKKGLLIINQLFETTELKILNIRTVLHFLSMKSLPLLYLCLIAPCVFLLFFLPAGSTSLFIYLCFGLVVCVFCFFFFFVVVLFYVCGAFVWGSYAWNCYVKSMKCWNKKLKKKNWFKTDGLNSDGEPVPIHPIQ